MECNKKIQESKKYENYDLVTNLGKEKTALQNSKHVLFRKIYFLQYILK